MSKSTKVIANALQSIAFSSLPKLGAALDEGTFQGVITSKDGTHAAVVLLGDKPVHRMTWDGAKAWAEGIGGQLPSRPISALLYANAKALFQRTWYWTQDELQADTGDEEDASCAWYCYFYYGDQSFSHKGAEGAAVAVRLIPLTN